MIEVQVVAAPPRGCPTVRKLSGRDIATVTADSGYAYAKVYGGLERRGIDPVIPARRDPSQSRVPLRLFRYDARNNVLKCPRGKTLSPIRGAAGWGRLFRSMGWDARCVGVLRT